MVFSSGGADAALDLCTLRQTRSVAPDRTQGVHHMQSFTIRWSQLL